MRIAAVLLSGFFALALNAGAQLTSVHTVYLLPMTGGLDQYLANRLTNSGLFQVVMDPKKADAVFTDRLGDATESRLAELYPEPPAPQPEPAATPAAGKTEGNPKAEGEDSAKSKEAPPTAHFSTFGKGKGTIFLVDGRKRTVLWSFYETPKGSTSEALDRTATQVVERLKRDLKGK
jgi:hypothetical protein